MEMPQIMTQAQEISPSLAGKAASGTSAAAQNDPQLFAVLMQEILLPPSAAATAETLPGTALQTETPAGVLTGIARDSRFSARSLNDKTDMADDEQTGQAAVNLMAQLMSVSSQLPALQPQPVQKNMLPSDGPCTERVDASPDVLSAPDQAYPAAESAIQGGIPQLLSNKQNNNPEISPGHKIPEANPGQAMPTKIAGMSVPETVPRRQTATEHPATIRLEPDPDSRINREAVRLAESGLRFDVSQQAAADAPAGIRGIPGTVADFRTAEPPSDVSSVVAAKQAQKEEVTIQETVNTDGIIRTDGDKILTAHRLPEDLKRPARGNSVLSADGFKPDASTGKRNDGPAVPLDTEPSVYTGFVASGKKNHPYESSVTFSGAAGSAVAPETSTPVAASETGTSATLKQMSREVDPDATPVQPAVPRAQRQRTPSNQAQLQEPSPVAGPRKSEPKLLQTSTTVEAAQADVPVDVTFVSRVAKELPQEKNGNGSETLSQNHENIPHPAIAVTRPIGSVEPVRATLQANGTEARNALHESIMAQVSESIVRHDGKGNGQMTVRLNPQELGELRINVRVEEQRVKVEVVSDNRTVREALMGNIDALKETMSKQNLSMDGFAVSTGSGNGFNQPFKEERGEQRNTSRIPFGTETAQHDQPLENKGTVWGNPESLLVDLRL